MEVIQFLMWFVALLQNNGTLILALTTFLLAAVSVFGSKQQAIATTEAAVLPKIQPDFTPPTLRSSTDFQIMDNPCINPRMSLHYNNGDIQIPNKEITIGRESGGQEGRKLRISEDAEDKLHEKLQIWGDPPQNIELRLRFESATGGKYEYRYKTNYVSTEPGEQKMYWVENYEYIGKTVPWKGFAIIGR